jgi:phosphonatase-like hydrolase
MTDTPTNAAAPEADGSDTGGPDVELVCLDMAGTTVDDGTAVLDSFAVAVAEAGLHGADRDAAIAYATETMGSSKIEVFRAILGGDEARARAANATFERAYDEVVARGAVRAMPGAAELFAACRRDGVAVCLTTGFAPPTRDAILHALGWEAGVDLVLSPADAGRGRPWPDMILTAVIRLEVGDVRSVAVAGDTTNDLWAGHRSGAAVVAGVLSGAHTAEQLGAAPHTHLLNSVADLGPIVLAG